MKKMMLLFSIIAISGLNYLHIKAVEFFYIDTCLDRGGRFLPGKLMCETEQGFISFNPSPALYIFTCVTFGTLTALIFRKFFLLSQNSK